MRVISALFLSLAIHFGILACLLYHKKDEQDSERQRYQKTTINYVKLISQKQQSIPKKVTNNQPIKEIFKEKESLYKIHKKI